MSRYARHRSSGLGSTGMTHVSRAATTAVFAKTTYLEVGDAGSCNEALLKFRSGARLAGAAEAHMHAIGKTVSSNTVADIRRQLRALHDVESAAMEALMRICER